MKKLALTLAIILGLSLSTFADPNGGGLFGRGEQPQQQTGQRLGGAPMLPGHGHSTNQPAPLGGGILVLTAFGAAYLVGKRRHEN
jgi:hypothetical protein